MKHFFRALILILLLVSTIELFANHRDFFSVKKLTTANGLSQNDIRAIAQDSSGLIWLCTSDGINRYDGYDFNVFRIGDKGLISNFSNVIEVDNKGNLWIGTQDYGLLKFDNEQKRFVRVYDYLPESLSLPTNIMNIAIDGDSRVWVADKNTLYCFIKQNERYNCSIHKFPEYENIRSITLNDKKQLLVVTKNRVYTNNEGNFEVLYTIANVNSIFYSNGHTYLRVESRIHKYNEKEKKLEDLICDKVKASYVDSNNKLWVTKDDGVFVIDLKSERYVETMISNQKYIVSQIFEDTFGNIWIGTYRTGLLLVHKNKPFNTFITESSVESLTFDSQDRLWVGELSGNVYCYLDSLNNRRIPISIGVSNKTMISYITQHKSTSKIFISDYYGTYYAKLGNDISNLAFSHIPVSRSNYMLEDGKYMWLATFGSGLMLFNVETNEIEQMFEIGINGTPSELIRSLAFDKYKNLWIATGRGLRILEANTRFDKNPTFRNIIFRDSIENPLQKSYLLSIKYCKNGQMWIGTLDMGVFCLSNINENFECDAIHYTTKDGLSNNTIRALEIDKRNNIWASTTWGINKIGSDGNIRSYTKSDGLQDYEFRDMSSSTNHSGELVFGGLRGFSVFNPEQIVENKTIPRIFISEFHINNSIIGLGDTLKGRVILKEWLTDGSKIELSYTQNSLTFYFSSIHYCVPEGSRYKYKLDGYEKIWNNTRANERVARYSNLAPGKYKFMVIGSNNDDTWSVPITITITIIPPIWNRWYSYVFYIFLIIILIYIFIKVMIKIEKDRIAITIAEKEKQYLNEFHKAKITFFLNVSHEFRTPLTIISSSIQRILNKKNLSEKQLEELLNAINSNSKILLHLINQTLDFAKNSKNEIKLNLKVSNIVSFFHQITEQFKTISTDKGVELSFSSQSSYIEVSFDEDLMQEVFYNLISNAIKHTPKGGSIDCIVIDNKDYIDFQIVDTGVGIAPNIKDHIFEQYFSQESFSSGKDGVGIGLFLTKKLVELNGGIITFRDNEKGGTIFTVRLSRSIPSSEKSKFPNQDMIDVIDKGVENLSETSIISNETKILVVEDNRNIVELLSLILSEYYSVITAYDGEQGYRKCLKNMPSLVITDIMMPNSCGLQMCRMLKNDIKTNHIPVIVLTAKTTDLSRTESYSAFADAFLAKPFDNKVLIALVKSTLVNRRNLAEKFRNDFIFNSANVKVTNVDDDFLKHFIELIDVNISEENLNISFFAEKLGLNSVALNRKLKDITGHTAISFIRTVKLKRAAEMLATNRYTVKEVTYATGFNDLRYFRLCFRKEFGILPSDYGREFEKRNLHSGNNLTKLKL